MNDLSPEVCQKLDHVFSCLRKENYEDTAAYLCDLLEMCRLKIINHQGMMFVNLESVVRKYGSDPKPPKEM